MITSIRIKNFKCFPDQTVPLGPLVVLSGVNGTGKSSILQALLLLRQSYAQGAPRDVGLVLNGDWVQLGTAQDALYEFATEDEVAFHLAWSDGGSASWVCTYDRQTDVMSFSSAAPDMAATLERPPFSDGFQYLQAERVGPRMVSPMADTMVRRHRLLGAAGEYTAHFLREFGTRLTVAPRRQLPRGRSSALLHQVEAWLQEVRPGVEPELGALPGVDLLSLRYSFLAQGGRSRAYRATNVGFGVTYTLPVVVALLSAQPGDLVLIENPEAHLHPHGQVAVGRLLARAAGDGVQVIAETHSDHVINGVRLAVRDGVVAPDAVSLLFLRLADTGQLLSTVVDTPCIDRHGRIDVWPDGFFDEYERSLLELMRPAGS